MPKSPSSPRIIVLGVKRRFASADHAKVQKQRVVKDSEDDAAATQQADRRELGALLAENAKLLQDITEVSALALAHPQKVGQLEVFNVAMKRGLKVMVDVLGDHDTTSNVTAAVDDVKQDRGEVWESQEM